MAGYHDPPMKTPRAIDNPRRVVEFFHTVPNVTVSRGCEDTSP